MKIKIDFIGIVNGKSAEKIQEFDEGTDILTLLHELVQLYRGSNHHLLSSVQRLRSSTLILVNQKEISVLEGLETRLHDRDKVTIVPITHGG
jgi:molybdopterin converting factor small subunit